MPDGYRTIATYDSAIAAELARVRLDADNIPAFIANSNMASVNPFYSAAIGVRVQVPIELAEQAANILNQEKFPIFMNPQSMRKNIKRKKIVIVTQRNLPG